MVTSVRSDYGMGIGKVVIDDKTKSPKISQKVAGLDINEYISAVKEARKSQEQPYQDKIDQNTKTLAALSKFQDKLKTVQDLAQSMANRVSSSQPRVTMNAFSQHSVEATSSSGQDYNSIVRLIADERANKGAFSVKVNQLATSDMKKGTITTTGINAALGITGNFSITSTSGTAQDVNITPEMSLADIQGMINDVSGKTKVSADISLVSIGAESTYELKLKAQVTGEPIVLKDPSGEALSALGISQVTTNKICGIVQAANEAAALDLSGSLTIGIQGGGNATIDLDPSMTLTEVINQINSQSGITGVTASHDLAFYSDPSRYQIKLESNLGTVEISDTSGAITSLGLDVPVTDFNDLCAMVTVDGTDYKKRSNTITDIINGVQMNLQSVSGATVSGTVVDDKFRFVEQFDAFLTAYNDLIGFYNSQTKTKTNSDGGFGGAAEDADLYGNKFVRDSIMKLKASLVGGMSGASFMTGQSSGGTARVSTLAGMGLKIQPDGSILYVNDTDFGVAVDTHYDDIKELLANSISVSNNDFSITDLPTKLPGNISGKPITISLSKTESGETTAKFIIDFAEYEADVTTEGTNIKIIGKKDSDTGNTLFHGVSVIFRGTLDEGSSVESTMRVTQGRMAQLDSELTMILNENRDEKTGKKLGAIFGEIDLLTKNNESQQKLIDKIDANAKKEAARLEKDFMKVYEMTFELENIMNMIEAFNKAN